MAAKGQSDIDRLMDKYTQRRRAESGQPIELSGPARNELHAEVEEHYGRDLVTSQEAAKNFTNTLAWQQGMGRLGHKLVTWLGFAGAACLALIVAFVAANHRDEEAPPTARSSSDFLQVAQADTNPTDLNRGNSGGAEAENSGGAPAGSRLQPVAPPAPSPTISTAPAKPAPTITIPVMPDPSMPIAEAESVSKSIPKPKPRPTANASAKKMPPPLLGAGRDRTLDSTTAPASELRPVGRASAPSKRIAKAGSRARSERRPVPIVVTIPPLPTRSATPAMSLADVESESSDSPVPEMKQPSAERQATRQIRVPSTSGPSSRPAPAMEASPGSVGRRARIQIPAAPRPETKTTYLTAPGYKIVGGPVSEPRMDASTTRRSLPAKAKARSSIASFTAPSGTQRFVQTISRGGFRSNLTAAPERQVLGAFDLRITGRQVTIKDGDGSIYNGTTQPNGPGGGLLKFSAKGLHRTTKQRVEFAGTYGPGTGPRGGKVTIEGLLTRDGKVRSRISAVKRQ
jgi:hypothetical protein